MPAHGHMNAHTVPRRRQAAAQSAIKWLVVSATLAVLTIDGFGFATSGDWTWLFSAALVVVVAVCAGVAIYERGTRQGS